MTEEVKRETIKLGLDFRPIPVDMGDGVEWAFHSDPSPEKWKTLVDALRAFSKLTDDDGLAGGDVFEEALDGLTEAMGGVLVDPAQRKAWIKRRYGLGPQQAVSEALMDKWTGFPTKRPSGSGKGSKRTG